MTAKLPQPRPGGVKPTPPPAPPPKNHDDRHKACRVNERRLQASLDAITAERNAMLKATNEHTVRCFAERDQLQAELAEAKKHLIEATHAHESNTISVLAAQAKADLAAANRIVECVIAHFEDGVNRCLAEMRTKAPEEQIAFASEMARTWQAAAVRVLEGMWAYPRPIPSGRFEDLVVKTCNDAIINTLRAHGYETAFGLPLDGTGKATPCR